MQLRQEGQDSEIILKGLEERLAPDLNFGGGHILGSMCSAPDEIVPLVFSRFLEKNIGDPGLFPATVELEQEVINTIGTLLGGSEVSGSIVTGGTEANIVAMWAAKRRAGKGRREVLVPDSAHFSFDKAADLMDLDLIRIPLDSMQRVRVAEVEAAISDRTMALLGIAGSTGLGAVDPLEELSRLAVEHDLYLHIDAAFGGFVVPFLEEAGYRAPPFGFTLPGVSSITIDPHKMGRSAVPAGCIVFRNQELASYAETNVTYLAGGETTQRTIAGTRSGASVAAVWAVLQRLGRSGYVALVRRAMETTHWLAAEVRKIPSLSLMVEPTVNILGITTSRGDVAELTEELRRRGWAVSLFDGYMRVVVMPHVSRESLAPFLALLRELVDR